jgi:hypothetical protein
MRWTASTTIQAAITNGEIGEHMTGVGEQRQRARDQAADHLGHHETAGQQRRDADPRLIYIGGCMVVSDAHCGYLPEQEPTNAAGAADGRWARGSSPYAAGPL